MASVQPSRPPLYRVVCPSCRKRYCAAVTAAQTKNQLVAQATGSGVRWTTWSHAKCVVGSASWVQ